MQAKIIKIHPLSTSNSGWSTIKVELDNDMVGEILLGQNKSSHSYKEGDEISFDLEENQYGKKFKKVQNLNAPKKIGGGSPKDPLGMTVGHAINAAVALIVGGKAELKDLKSISNRIIQVSEELKKEWGGKIS